MMRRPMYCAMSPWLPWRHWWHGLAMGLALLLSVAAFGAGGAGAMEVGEADRYELSNTFTFLEDPSNLLTLDEVRQPDVQARFQAVQRSGPATNFGLTRSAIWLRIMLETKGGISPDWLLEVAYPPLDDIQLYAPDGRGGWAVQRAGDQLPFALRPVPHRNHVMPLKLNPGETHTLYVRVSSHGTVSAPILLWRPSALWAHDQAAYAALSLYFGLLAGLLLYNLLLFVAVRDSAYLIYVAFVGGMAVAQAALTGLGAQFLWPQWVWWNTVSPPAGMAIAATFGVQFARVFLASATRMPQLDRGLKALVVAWAVTLLVALGLPYVYSSWMTTVLSVATVSLLLVVGGVSVRRAHPGAWPFVAAWAVLLLGVSLLMLHNTGWLPSNPVTSNALLICSALEMVLLSFALANRINSMRFEKEQAQARTAAEHAMVEALSESQARYRMLLEEREVILKNSLVGIAFLTAEGRFRWANDTMQQILGLEGKSQLVSMESIYLSRAQYLEVGGDVAQAVAKGEIYERELQVRRSDGKEIWILLSGKGVSSDDLSQGTVWVVMDITRRKELEAQLQHSSSEREAILNSATVGIVLTANRRIQWANLKFARMVGYAQADLIGKSTRLMLPDPLLWEHFGTEVRRKLEDDGVHISEQQLPRRDGSRFWVEMGGSCVHPNKPELGVIWSILDIGERKRSEFEIREALEQQKVLNALRSRFVAMTSHEFRTPLSSILLAGELLRDYSEHLPQAERIEILDSISEAVGRISRMLDRVLLLGRADAEMLEFKPRDVDLPALCRQMMGDAKAEAGDAPVQMVLTVSPTLQRGSYDDKLLRHIVGNLLSNAIKYSPQGGTVHLAVEHLDSHTVMTVTDEGIGIPPEEVAHLYDSFHRGSNVGDIPGTGLGLAIVKSAVDKYGGHIDVQSTPGQGTCFTVRLPAAGPGPPR
jgi:PAS domain S-box-containing protein